MFQPYSRSKKTRIRTISKCHRHQQASIQCGSGSQSILTPPHSSERCQNQPPLRSVPSQSPENLGIASFTASQPPGHEMFNQGVGLGIENKCSREPIPPSLNPWTPTNGSLISDEEAAEQIERRLKRPNNQLAVRILRNLVNRSDMLDDTSLDDLLHAADKTIFGGDLYGKVRWEWSTGQPGYESELLGTTAFRHDPSVGGFETLIVLSRPLLVNPKYRRDLLLSAFLHELVHCYLFIRCGLSHAKDDGHTKGFREIAKHIDRYFRRRYFGHQRLYLCNMRANLEYFRVGNGHNPEQHLNEAPVYRAVAVMETTSTSHSPIYVDTNCLTVF